MKNGITFIMVLVTALLTACSGDKTEKNTNKEEELPLVKLAQVRQRSVEQLQDYTATVEAEAVNNIAPSSPVRIDKILVEVGDKVRTGQKLVSMDEARLKQMELQLANQRIEFERTDELYKVGGASKSEWDAMKMAYEVQETAVKDLRKNTSLISPINGVVTARNYDNGDLFSGALPVLVVEQITPVKLLIHISENHYTDVKQGEDVEVKLDVFDDEIFKGKVNLIYPTIDPNTRTFTVEIQLQNKDQRVRPGMFARVTVNFGEKQHVVVPDMAVVKQHGAGDHYVYVYDKGKVTYNKVELGRRLSNEYELISGVPDSAQVVVAGQSHLANGIAVKVQK